MVSYRETSIILLIGTLLKMKMKDHENIPAIIQPKTTRTTAVTTIMEGFFFSIQQAKSKLDKGRSLLKTLYLKI